MSNQSVHDSLSFFAALYQVDHNSKVGMWLLYLTIALLSIFVYKLGFARKLPVLQSLCIYTFLLLGCTILTFLAIFLPIGEGLVAAALILIVYRIRLYQQKKSEAQNG